MIEEQIIQKLPRRCPYCDRILKDDFERKGERVEEICPYCGRVIVRLSWEEAVRLGRKETP